MGLLDGLLGNFMGGANNSGGSNPLVQIAMQMLSNKGGGGSSGGTLERTGKISQ